MLEVASRLRPEKKNLILGKISLNLASAAISSAEVSGRQAAQSSSRY